MRILLSQVAILGIFILSDIALAAEPTFPGLVKREFIYDTAPFPQ